MREINSGRIETNIRIETKEETINRGWKKEEVGAENQHLSLKRKKEGEGA